jgi:hypothetical protein
MHVPDKTPPAPNSKPDEKSPPKLDKMPPPMKK